MLLGQNSVAETKIFTKLLPYKRSDLSLRRVVATCCCNLSPSVFKEGGKTRKLLADAGKPYGRMELGEGGGTLASCAFVQIGRKLTRLEWMIFP